MEKIKSLDSHNFNNGDFLQFNANVLTIAVQYPFLASITAQFSSSVNLLESSFLKEKLTLETKKIIALDKERDAAYLHFKLRVEAEKFNWKFPEKTAAAVRIESIIKQHGRWAVTRYDFNRATATFTSFVDAVNNQEPEALQQLGLVDELHAIGVANKAFSTFYNLRNQLAAERSVVPSFSKVRPAVQKSYKDFIKALESMPLFDASRAAEVEQIIKRINVEVNKFKLLLPASKSKSAGN